MDIIELYRLLTFDSIYGGLSWDERIQAHYIIAGRCETFSQNVEETILELKKIKWRAPHMRYLKNEVGLYCEDPDTLSVIKKDIYIQKYPNPLKNE